MRLRIRNDVYQLFQDEDELIRTLDWILGYIDAQRGRRMTMSTFFLMQPGTGIHVDLPDDLANQAIRRVGDPRDLEAGINLFLLSAYLTGGQE